jgi:hypothetical protein
MKRHYQKPETNIIPVILESHLTAGSNFDTNNPTSGGDASMAASRRQRQQDWDDEE